MKINLNNKYSDIGDLPVYKELTVKEMILSESYFPNGMKMYKKLYYALIKFLFLYVKKVKNKIQKIIQSLYNNKNRVINKTNTIGNEELKISLVIPVFSYSDAQQLRKTYQSVISQEGITEGNIMIIANECHNITDLETIKFVNSDELVLEMLNSYFLKEDCDIVSVLPCGDVLHPNALVCFKNIITTDLDLVYCNETILDGDDYYKPNYSPDTLRSYNYIGDFIFCNKTLFEKIGGMNTHAGSSYSYYFNLKATYLANKVHHINEILLTLTPEREFDTELNKQQLISFLDERDEKYDSISTTNIGHYIVNYTLSEESKISIIIPTKNRASILQVCLESIFNTSTYKNYEVIVIDNNSDEEELQKLLVYYETKHPSQFKSVKDLGEFNFARIMNDAVPHCSGEYYLFLNNDTEVITPNWLQDMLAYAQRNSIGVVGAKLLFPNNTIQHCGIQFIDNDPYHIHLGYDKQTAINRGQADMVYNYDALTGACMFISHDTFNQVNGFDTSFKVGYNDIDLCLKLTEKGYTHIYLPNVQLYHYESISRGNPFSTPKARKQSIMERNKFQTKWSKILN